MKEEDIDLGTLEEVHFEIDKNAFKGPFTCCKKKTRKTTKKTVYKGLEFQHEVWQCSRCKKEYLDLEQSKRMETFWTMKQLLDDKLITMERSINFDGKTYFFRFPKEISQNWGKGRHVDIKLLTPEKFLVEVKA